jgi:type IV pilus assembly protein PilN
MIRINLLGAERPRSARKAFIPFDIGNRLTLAATLILVVAALVIAGWYWSLSRESSQVDADVTAAQQELTRLRSVFSEVQEFERQRQVLQERVALIERLRSGQSIPVQLLDHVSRSLPDMLWLISLQQEGDDVTIEGRSTTLIALSDFVGNLGNTQLLLRPIEIVNSQVQPATGTGVNATPELIAFTVRARINRPAQAEPEPAGRGARGRGARGRRGGAS